MALREAVIGVQHKGCWGSLSTVDFPEISMTEVGPIQVKEVQDKIELTATWNVSYQNQQQFLDYLESLKKYSMIQDTKVIRMEATYALLKTTWLNETSSYQTVFNNKCLYISPVTQEKGYEVYTVITENPEEIKEMLEKLEHIGDVKLFKVGNVQSDQNKFELSNKQLNAFLLALHHEYYTWPRKKNLNDLADTAGIKRRALQENLRKAEAKVMEHVKKQLVHTVVNN